MNRITIVAIVYREPEYEDTRRCIEATGLPVVWVERDPIGVGSLAEAVNRGVRMAPLSDFLFIVTNVTFSKDLPVAVAEEFNGCPTIAAIAPCFDSDHKHSQQQKHACPIQVVPFVEFTAVMVRDHVMRDFPLDEDLEYVGHDMDWGVRMRRAAWMLAVDHREKLGHTYIRHKKERNAYTEKRKMLRKAALPQTISKLKEKYGMNYKDIIQYHNRL
jgi:hypothetical protein